MTSKLTTLLSATTALVLICALSACSSTDDREVPDPVEGHPHTTTEETDDGLIAERTDTIGDGNPDIIRYFEEYQDPGDEDRTRRRLVKMEIDATGDGTINVRRNYDEYGNVELEENDQNLDGTIDTILEFTGGELTRKKILDDEERVRERRIYYEDQLVRVEHDTNRDGNTDRWEYYEDGVLMRIGTDTSRDGSADTWQLR